MKCRMQRQPSSIFALITGLLALLLGSGCQQIAMYDSRAHEQTQQLKQTSLALMDRADEPYIEHHTAVEKLQVDLHAADRHAAHRPRNAATAAQWQRMLDPQGYLLGGFLQRWQIESVLSPTFIDEAKQNVSDAFDAMLELEAGKLRTGGQR